MSKKDSTIQKTIKGPSTKRTKNGFRNDDPGSMTHSVGFYFENGVAKDFETDVILSEKELAALITATRYAKANARKERLAQRAEKIAARKAATITRQKAQLERIRKQKSELAKREAKLREKLAA